MKRFGLQDTWNERYELNYLNEMKIDENLNELLYKKLIYTYPPPSSHPLQE